MPNRRRSSRSKKARPTNAQRAWQRELRDWLAASRHRFNTDRVIRVRMTMRYVQVLIEGLNPLLSIHVRPWNMGVDVDWQGRWFDRVFDLDLDKVRKAGEFYGCSECMDYGATKVEGPIQLFPSVAALRIKHQYETFLDWCNEDLFPARLIQIVSIDGSSGGGACLLRDMNDSRAQAIPHLLTGLVKRDGNPVARPEELSCSYLPVWLPPSHER